MKVLIAGGSGFIGKHLAQHFIEKGDQVVVLTRRASHDKDGVKYLQWDAKNLGEWSKELNTTDLVINLTGKSVNCRYTEENKKEILSSRVDSTNILGQAIEQCATPPKLWLNSSTATIYRHSEDLPMTEDNGEMGDDFSMTVAKKWEEAFYSSDTPSTRKIALRISLVLARDGGVMPPFINLVKWGLGGAQGKGTQKFAWIHIEDFVRIVDFLVLKEHISGPVNCAADSDIDNAEFMREMRYAFNRPIGLPAFTWMLEIGAFLMGTETELILKSRWVKPLKLLKNGFTFAYPTIDKALVQIANE